VTPTVLVVEDDPLIASSLSRALSSRGYEAPVAGSVAAALDALASGSTDLVLLDLGLPDGDGGEVCDFVLHKLPHVPVIVLTARSDEIDVVLGLEMGAVDYVAKPFRLAELVARIQTHLRFAASQGGPADGSLVIDDLVVDRARRRVHLGDEEVSLRPKEFDVLERLAIDAGRVVTREQLIDEVWDENWWGSTKTLDVHINSLRRKLGERPGGSSRITTIRGVGYRLDPRTTPR
jgi:DNA-binding response OmpR family regulator